MKKKLILMLCLGLVLTSCAKTEKNHQTTEVVQKQTSAEETSDTADSAEATEAVTAQSEESSDKTEMVEIPFGYQLETGYNQYFSFKMPAAATFSLGYSNGGNDSVEGGMDCAEFAPEAEAAQLEYATFSDPDFINGTVTITVHNLGHDFDTAAESWMESAETALGSFKVTKDSGEINGYTWQEIYGLNDNGSFQYGVLVKLDDQIAAEFSLLGGSQGKIHDYDEVHSYFFDALDL